MIMAREGISSIQSAAMVEPIQQLREGEIKDLAGKQLKLFEEWEEPRLVHLLKRSPETFQEVIKVPSIERSN